MLPLSSIKIRENKTPASILVLKMDFTLFHLPSIIIVKQIVHYQTCVILTPFIKDDMTFVSYLQY